MHVGGVKWSVMGSLNGGEISYKVNHEVVLMVDHLLVYERLLEVFLHDWRWSYAKDGYYVDYKSTPSDVPPVQMASFFAASS
jgi:hypothetical protein